jgi:type II secretory pathway predicted ATPase ExeA
VNPLFEGFYGFKETPFSRTITTDKLYRGNDSDELIERLKYAAARRLFAVLTGDSGAGKTTTLRRFTDELKPAEHIAMYISDSKLTPRYFYKELLEQLGFESKWHSGDAKRQLHKEIELIRLTGGRSPVVIVDEAHLLSRDMLEEVRFLLNFRMDSQSPMALILAGQTELWDKLRLQSYAAIRQRIDIMCAVAHLDRIQTTEYIGAHMAYAGCEKEIFSEAAIDDMFRFSGGIPRLINKACTCSLMYGAQNRKSIIDDRMVKLVIEHELN